MNSEYSEAYYSLALVFESMKMYDKAIEKLKIGLKWREGNKTYLNRIASLSFGIGKFKEAKLYTEKVLDKYPKNPTALKNLALILYNMKNYEKSFEYYQKLKNINPNFDEPLLNYYSLKGVDS